MPRGGRPQGRPPRYPFSGDHLRGDLWPFRLALMTSVAANSRASDTWHPARLIPVVGIRGQEEQEKRATSALLAVMQAVPDFGHALLADARAPRGRISTFAEVQLKDSDGKVSIPDGAIVVERGKTRWRAIVEVKTGGADLKSEQVNRYLDMARDHGFQALITISGQITPRPSEPPVAVDRRKTKRVNLFHLSWWRVITEAVLQHRHRGITDPDQAWILGELIAYLDHPKSGAGGFEDMGPTWVRVRDGARQGTVRGADPEVRATSEHWMQFVDYLALSLSQELGREVTPFRPPKQTTAARLEMLVHGVAENGCLTGGLRIPDAIAPVAIRADLRARQVTTSVTLDAPREGRPSKRINWLLRQLRDADPNLRVEVAFANVKETTSLLLHEAAEYPQRLLSPSDPKREPRKFTIALTRPMGLKNGKAQGSFVGETREQVVAFYGGLVQILKGWRPPAPKLPAARPEHSRDEGGTESGLLAETEPQTSQDYIPPKV
jgi:hypothetical protein